MDRGCNGGGVKVTFIETQFVTSDAAGFKSLVQRLTGRNDEAAVTGGAGTAPPPLRRPRPCRADGWRGAGGADGHGGASATVGAGRRAAVPPAPWVDEMTLYEMCDLAEMFCVDVGESGGRCHGSGYGGFPC